jgi:hypothetical protein
VVFTGNRYGFLDDEDRDAIWRRFGVPVFEQVLDDEGRIFASECEAHIGLHIDPGVHHSISNGELLLNGRPTGIHVRELSGVCGCGRSGARVLDAGPALTHAVKYSA